MVKNTEASEMWHQMMMKRLGMTREELKKHLSEQAKKRANDPNRKPHPGGQFRNNPDLARELGAKGRALRWSKK